jgi:calcium uniporter protein, mitochondrial
MATNPGWSREAANQAENINVSHSRFLAEGSRSTEWKESPNMLGNGGLDHKDEESDLDAMQIGQG